MTGQEQCGFCPLPSHRLSHMGGGTHKSLVNTGGLNCSLGTDPGSVGKPGCSPGSWDQTQPWEACSLPGSQYLRAVNETCIIGGNPCEDEDFIPISGKKALVCRGQGKWGGRFESQEFTLPRFRV